MLELAAFESHVAAGYEENPVLCRFCRVLTRWLNPRSEDDVFLRYVSLPLPYGDATHTSVLFGTVIQLYGTD
jgi:hypothetical protein